MAFASQADTREQTVTLVPLAKHVWACMAEGDPNVLVVEGPAEVLIVDSTATPVMAKAILERIRTVTDKPVRKIVFSHYHAVRTLGASAFPGADVIASRGTAELIRERGQQDYASEYQRFPRLFRAAESIPGLTWPTVVFDEKLSIMMGDVEVQAIAAGRAHTKGDTVVWLPKERILFGGDTIDHGTAPYCGDAYLRDWPMTVERVRALDPAILIPGRGPALRGAETRVAFDFTAGYVLDLVAAVRPGVERGAGLREIWEEAYPRMKTKYGQLFVFEHCIPFSVSRAVDELRGVADPVIWTSERDQALWQALRG